MDHPPPHRLLHEGDDPEVAAHLAACATCRAARDRALTTSDWSAAPSAAPPAADRESVYLSGEALDVAPGGHLEVGAVVAGHVVEAELGRGGMALVYRVRHQVLGTPRALKVLQLSGPALTARVLREGRAMARLVHPNVVRVLDVATVNGAPALLMDLVDRGSLDELLAEHRLPLPDGLALFRGILAGVAAAHRDGVVHRDLKPANVLLATGPAGETVPRVSDFGLAKATEAGERSMTRSGSTLGTLIYMAPEQVRDSSRVDARADVFSLGCILYEIVTGRRAFSACDPIEQHEQATTRAWARPEVLAPELPADLVALLDRMLAPDREDRPRDADAVLALLGPAPSATTSATPAPVVVRPPPAPALAPPRPRVRWGRAVVAALVPWALAATEATARLDLVLQTPVVRAIRGELPLDDVLVVGLEGRSQEDVRALRPRHAELLGALVDAGARAVVFDFLFRAPTEHDAAFADALRAASDRGVPVVLATRMDGQWPLEVLPELADLGRVGVAEFEADLLTHVVRRFPVRQRRRDSSPVWHVAIEAARAVQHADAPGWTDGVLEVGALDVAAPQEAVALPPAGDPERVSYDDPAALAAARGKVVLVGAIWDEDVRYTPDGPRYGVELLAVAVQTVLSRAGLARSSVASGVALALAAQVATAGLAASLPGRSRWLVALVPLGILAIGAALASGETVLPALPALLAVALVAWSLPRAP